MMIISIIIVIIAREKRTNSGEKNKSVETKISRFQIRFVTFYYNTVSIGFD